ncbi:hypothetical protein [Maribacter sp. 2210JD10-5]|uniref:hypothetical protein n=1 Tax=Maribacter sp. 2210JD10-5 TaxID=3386272 RepID=UPI0039BC7AC2
MALITSGKRAGCKTTIGGIKLVYLATFVPYQRNEFGLDGTVLTSIPETFIYRFELDGDKNSFSQSYDGKSYSQSLSLEFKKQDVTTSKLSESLNYLDYRALILDRNGDYYLLGLENGLTSTGIQITSGGSTSDFNGYSISFNGKERLQALHVIDPFNNGFIEVDGEDFYQFQNLETFCFQDGELYQFN